MCGNGLASTMRGNGLASPFPSKQALARALTEPRLPQIVNRQPAVAVYGADYGPV
jgi:hypothetical protein